MIKINDQFSVERDKYQWLLHETKDGMSKLGEPIKVTRTTYHAKLKQCCNEVSERMMGECESVQEIKKALNDFVVQIDNISLFERGDSE